MADREKLINELANDIAFHCHDMVENGCGVYNCASCLAERLADDGYHKAVQKWIPVTERLPEAGDIVLVYGSRGGVYTAYMHRPNYWHNMNSESHYCNPTHWMPLPSTEGLNEK